MISKSPSVTDFSEFLGQQLATDRDAGLSRQLPACQTADANFSSNDYLGLSRHPAVIQAAIDCLHENNEMGAGAARLISGNRSQHEQLEASLAKLKRAAACLLFPNGYAAACGAITTLMDRSGTILLDRSAHACLFDGARLSGAKVRVFDHNDTTSLDQSLQWLRQRDANAPILIITESLFSMEGDTAPLREIVELKVRHNAWLMVDEAHATGAFGTDGRGLCDDSLSGQIEIQMGTLGKALGVCGGFITGPNDLIALLRNRARSFLFTTAMPACLSAAAIKAVEICRSKQGHSKRRRLASHIRLMTRLLPGLPEPQSQIIPVPVGDEKRALEISAALLAAGLSVPAIRYPTVPRGAAILRISLNSELQEPQINTLAAALRQHLPHLAG